MRGGGQVEKRKGTGEYSEYDVGLGEDSSGVLSPLLNKG